MVGTQVLGRQGNTATVQDGDCDLGVANYEMGVYGHLSGNQSYGVSVNQNGVFSAEFEATTVTTADAQCS